MGLEPTRCRCASEALLRRLRKDGSLPRIHPLVDLCNAISVAFAVPVAAFGVAEVLVVAEALHESAQNAVASLLAALEDELRAVWSAAPSAAILSRSSPRFDPA